MTEPEFWRDIPDHVLEQLLFSTMGATRSDQRQATDDNPAPLFRTLSSEDISIPHLFPFPTPTPPRSASNLASDGTTAAPTADRSSSSGGALPAGPLAGASAAIVSPSSSSSSSSAANGAAARGPGRRPADRERGRYSDDDGDESNDELSPVVIRSGDGAATALEAAPIQFTSVTVQLGHEQLATAEIDLARARSVISQAQQMVSSHLPALAEMYKHQQQIMLATLSDDVSNLIRQLTGQQDELVRQLDGCQAELTQLRTYLVLGAAELYLIRSLSQTIQLLKLKLELLSNELGWKINQSVVPPNGNSFLFLEDQPLPQVVFKEKAIDEQFTLRLISGSASSLDQFGLVQAELSSDEQQWRAEKPLASHQMTLDPSTMSVTFSKLRVNVSSRMAIVNLKFTVGFQHNLFGACQASSDVYPLIVITNESQWCDAEGKLILHDAFGNKSDIPYPLFANVLQQHFLKSTRQPVDAPRRPLSPQDWHYIHHRFFDAAPVVNHQQVLEFWTWFGGLVQTLRFKRHINSLWFDGLIFGIISKEQCQKELHSHELGTFLIRFSETFSGLFAIAYVSDDPFERVKHYLVKPEDTGSQKTLPDFLREKPQFQYLLKFNVGEGTLTRYSKDAALSQYYSKDRILKPAGYVLL